MTYLIALIAVPVLIYRLWTRRHSRGFYWWVLAALTPFLVIIGVFAAAVALIPD